MGFLGGVNADVALEGYQALANANSEGIYQLDADGRFVAVNDAIVESTGYAREALLDEHISIVVDEADVERLEQEIRTHLEADIGAVASLEFTVETAAGERKPVEAHIHLLRNEGEFRGTVGIIRDVTNPKTRERTTHSERELFDRVFEASPVGISALTPDGDIVTLNERAAEIVGTTPEEVAGSRYEGPEWKVYDADGDPIPPEERTFAKVVASGEPVTDFETQVERSDGTRVWLSVNGVPVFDPDDELSLVILSYEDITELKERERQLLQEHGQTEKLLQTAPIALSVQDASGNTLLANQRAQDLLGVSEHELIEPSTDADEWHVYDAEGALLDPEDYPSTRVLRTGEPIFDEELAIERPTGERMWVSVNVAPLLGSDGTLERIISAGEDITERKERERRIARRKDELETELGEILGRISDAFYALDEDWQFTHLNKHAEAVLQHTEDELLDRSVWEVFPNATEGVFWEQFHAAMDTQDPVTFEFHDEDTDEWLEFNAYPSETGLSVYFRDITERKQVERELRKSEKRFRTMMEQSPFSMQIFDAEGRTIAVNPAWERLWDASKEELDDYNILVDEQLEAAGLLPYIRDAFAGEDVSLPVIHYDPAEIGKPGRDRWIEGYAYPLLPGDGDTFEVVLIHHDITERKEREQELERYEMAVETVWDGITILDSDNRFVLVNETFCDITGYDREEVIGEHARLILDESTYEQAGELHTEVLEGDHDIATLAYELLTADGGTVPVEARFGPVEYADGSVGGAGVIRDITERRKQERELERALDLLAKTERIADVGGWEIDPDTMEVFWTEHLFELFEVQYDEEPPLDGALSIYHEDDRSIIEGAIENALDAAEPFDVEARFRTDAGEVRWLRVQGVPETDDGDVVSLRGAAQDVTERKAYEQSLKRYETLIEESTDVNAVVAPDGTIEYVTPSIEYVLGYEPDDMVGEDAFDHIHPDDREGAVDPFSALIDGGRGPANAEFRLRAADGSWVWLEARARDLRDDPDIDGIVVYTRDITDRKRYEERLSETIDKLEVSNERLEQFAYVASHDLQEPLRMVSSYLQLLEDRYADGLDEDAREYIDFAVDGADRMREMIDDLLAYSRVESKAEPLEPTDCDAVIERVRRNLQVPIEETDATIDVDPLPRVAADESQLEQVFQNLISNAIKYRSDEAPHIEIAADRVAGAWEFRVADNGIGMAPEHTDRIFEVFKRLHSRQEYPGTGIGLALCQRIVERHGGDIWVESELGEGTTFHFTIPAVERECTPPGLSGTDTHDGDER